MRLRIANKMIISNYIRVINLKAHILKMILKKCILISLYQGKINKRNSRIYYIKINNLNRDMDHQKDHGLELDQFQDLNTQDREDLIQEESCHLDSKI